MKIIIAGAGRIGSSIAESLSKEGHDITVIERDSDTVNTISNSLDVICVEGNAANPEILIDAGVEDTDLVLAMTESDEINMLCGVSALKLGASRVFARVREPEYVEKDEFLCRTLGLSLVVNPEYECATEIARILRFPGASRLISFSEGKLEIAEHTVQSNGPLAGVMLKNLKSVTNAKVLVSLVERDENSFIPNGDFVFCEGDHLSLAGTDKELRKFFSACKAYDKEVKNIIILGGSRTSVYLTRLLDSSGIKSTIVESNLERCEALGELVPNSCRVICGDGTRSDILSEEGISEIDAFVALTGDDGDNIITSLYARHCGAAKIITKVNHTHFSLVISESGIDSVITPKTIVANQIISYVRAISNSAGNSMEILYELADGKAEALEFIVSSNSNITDVPLKDLSLKKDLLIVGIIRDGKSIIPDGDTCIQPEDHIIIVAKSGLVRRLDDIFAL